PIEGIAHEAHALVGLGADRGGKSRIAVGRIAKDVQARSPREGGRPRGHEGPLAPPDDQHARLDQPLVGLAHGGRIDEKLRSQRPYRRHSRPRRPGAAAHEPAHSVLDLTPEGRRLLGIYRWSLHHCIGTLIRRYTRCQAQRVYWCTNTATWSV